MSWYKRKTVSEERICACGIKFFTGRSPNKKFCSEKCSETFYHFRNKTGLNLAKSTIGSISEILVSADLMIRGFEVYKSISPSASCDLITKKNNEIKTIEVKTGHKMPNGKTYCRRKNIHAKYLAIYNFETKEIIYEPNL